MNDCNRILSFRFSSLRPRVGHWFVMVALACSRLSAGEEPDLKTWRAHRLEELTAPDGWLTLIGRHWLTPGDTTIGSAEDNRLVLAKGPGHLGRVSWDQTTGKVFFTLTPEVHASVKGVAVSGKLPVIDASDEATVVEVGTITLQVIARGDRKALRVRDSAADTRTHFPGLDYFAEDASWRIEARWEAFVPPRTLKLQNIVGQISDEKLPGKVTFERDGQAYELWPVQYPGEEDELFFVFSDQTSGKETYGGGRFLRSALPKDGKVVLDFNRAYNPPCALTPYATCPLPPRENRLPIRVEAGEKAPAAHP